MLRVFFTIFLFWTSLNLFSQVILLKESFFPPHKRFPSNYKTIIGDPKGWRGIAHYTIYNNKVDQHLSSWDTLSSFTPFRDGSMFSKIRRNKIIGRGDKRGVYKIIYVDNATLILESKTIEKIHHKNKNIKVRTLYKRIF